MNSTKQGNEIQISLDSASGVPFYRQIIQHIENAILSGKLKPGDRLPTIRSLAITLKINPNTIAKAYGEMEIRGIVVTQVGSGTYVSDRKPSSETVLLSQKIRGVLSRFLGDMENLGVDRQETVEMIRNFKEE